MSTTTVAPQHPRTLRRIGWLVGTIAVVLALAYSARGTLARGYIAYRIWRLHALHPTTPPGAAAEARFFWDVAGLRMDRDARVKRFEPELKPLVKQLSKLQASGRNVVLSTKIYREVRWWVNFTSDEAATRRRIADFKASLAGNVDQTVGSQQSEADGSWGEGYTVWFFKLYGSVNDALSRGAVPKYPLRFLDPINSPEKLQAHLDRIVHDRFLETGVINRQELDETTSALARLLFGDVKTDYPFHPQLKAAFWKFVDDWQNPETGCWGVWFVGRDGTVWKQDDVGMTFHMVSDRAGQVNHLPQLARRVLELSTADFPAGIRMHGSYENHLNWDVVKILKYAWPQLDEKTRQDARAEISRMLAWCLKESYQPDGSFRVSELDDTPEDAMEYGINFLQEIGFFRKKDRFWTDRDFPEARAVYAQIETHLRSMDAKSSGVRRSVSHLGKGAD